MTKDSRTAKAANRPKRKAPALPEPAPAQPPATTRLDQLATLLAQRDGASIAKMMSATGWQAHSVRGALAGLLKQRGLVITSGKIDGIRRYRSGGAQ